MARQRTEGGQHRVPVVDVGDSRLLQQLSRYGFGDAHTYAGPSPPPPSRGLLVLDVRSRLEFWLGHLDGATCIPVGKLARVLPGREDVSADTRIFVYCASGARSAADVAARKPPLSKLRAKNDFMP